MKKVDIVKQAKHLGISFAHVGVGGFVDQRAGRIPDESASLSVGTGGGGAEKVLTFDIRILLGEGCILVDHGFQVRFIRSRENGRNGPVLVILRRDNSVGAGHESIHICAFEAGRRT